MLGILLILGIVFGLPLFFFFFMSTITNFVNFLIKFFEGDKETMDNIDGSFALGFQKGSKINNQSPEEIKKTRDLIGNCGFAVFIIMYVICLINHFMGNSFLWFLAIIGIAGLCCINKRIHLAIAMTLMGIFILCVLPYDAIREAANSGYYSLRRQRRYTSIIVFPILLTIVGMYLLIKIISEDSMSRAFEPKLKEIKKSPSEVRKESLNMVSKFIVKKSNMWSDIVISNSNCSVYLQKDGKTITVKELLYPNKEFDAKDKNGDLFNTICYNFDESTKYRDLLVMAKNVNAKVVEKTTLELNKEEKIIKAEQKEEIKQQVIEQKEDTKMSDERSVDL